MSTPDAISDDERAVIMAFARRIRDGGQGMLSIAELLDRDPNRPREIRMAIERLAHRGWLKTDSPLQWDAQSSCILLGEGRDRAKTLSLEQSE